jgi:3-phenylpropionate/trans-cinnamate dioxygenase alpha subunit
LDLSRSRRPTEKFRVRARVSGAEKGDFLTAYVGADRILVVHQRDGSIRALLKACRHRGITVCRADLDNYKSFLCPFHGWTYDSGGNLICAPN